ncbi:MAG: preprotein translocase subunit SecA [bacterium]
MFDFIIKKIIGSKYEREVKRLQPYVDKVNSLEDSIKKLSDNELLAKTTEFRERFKNSMEEFKKRTSIDDDKLKNLDPTKLEEKIEVERIEKAIFKEENKILNDLLAEAFATVREAARRTLNMRHFDSQIMGGVVLHEGKIAEMVTGEGKTLVATLPVYLNSIVGRGVHVITVNDYLAKRDSEWMGRIYQFLGLTVGIIQHDMDDRERQKAYMSDVTYGTNNEFGFDYLRDNMKFDLKDYVQRDHFYAIVDEVDSILIDEARTPLIISGPTDESTDKYYTADKVVRRLKEGLKGQLKEGEVCDYDYETDEEAHTVTLTDEGLTKIEKALGINNLSDLENIEWKHHIEQATKAYSKLFKRDISYVVTDGEVIIVDEFTGRLMPGRRYSDGLHQALEAKENVKVANENQTLASITFQNYFRMYKKLAGMTGTADTEATEFNKIYNLDVIVVPTNKPLIRNDCPDVIYRTETEKFKAVVEEIVALNKKGRPALVGTISIENSEKLSHMLKMRGVEHEVLNAKHHEREAHIISMAGQPNAVTIATNMAGRGTDIVLGEGVAELGGLHVIGTERHESRRIDNQLRGRSGRQGDKGSSKFYISLEDDLMRIFGSERISGIMLKLGMEEGQPIEHRMISKAIEGAQKKVEGHNFEIRKNLLEYDDVMNKQRIAVYEWRKKILEGKNLKEEIEEMSLSLLEKMLGTYVSKEMPPNQWDMQGLKDGCYRQFGIKIDSLSDLEQNQEKLNETIFSNIKNNYDKKEHEFSLEVMRYLEKIIMLQTVDYMWKDHLYSMDHLKEGIGLRGYGQRDPLIEYKKESFEMFLDVEQRIKEQVVEHIFHVQAFAKEEEREIQRRKKTQQQLQEQRRTPMERKEPKTGRNDPCTCGSGKKYKKCCGK